MFGRGWRDGETWIQGRRRVLWLVLTINASMFVVEAVYGWLSASSALTADAVDFFGDSFSYAVTLFVLARSTPWKAAAALVKAALMGLFGLAVLAQTAHHIVVPHTPDALTIGVIGTAALAVNVVSALILFRHRGDDFNMRSAWLCSRNDAINSVLVIIAGAGVYVSATGWPDVAVGAVVASLSLSAAWSVIREVRGAGAAARPAGAADARR